MPYTIEAAQDGCYPGTTVLVNKFDLHTQKELNAVESVLVTAKTIQWSENPRCAAFDFEHYKKQSIDIYSVSCMIGRDRYGWSTCPKKERSSARWRKSHG